MGTAFKEKYKARFNGMWSYYALEINEPGCQCDALGQPCTVLIGSTVKYADKNNDAYFAGAGLKFSDSSVEVTFTDSEGKILGKKDIVIRCD